MKQKELMGTVLYKVKNLTFLVIASFLVVSAVISPSAKADQFDDQIRALQQQNDHTQGIVNGLQSQAASYQDAIYRLQLQISALQKLIDTNLDKQKTLEKEIAKNQAELDHERKVLGDDIKIMYIDGQISTVEILASSKNLSDFVDKEEYRIAVQNKIQETLVKINKLQKELKKQKAEVEQLLKDQKKPTRPT